MPKPTYRLVLLGLCDKRTTGSMYVDGYAEALGQARDLVRDGRSECIAMVRMNDGAFIGYITAANADTDEARWWTVGTAPVTVASVE